MALISLLTRLPRNPKVFRLPYLKPDAPCITVNAYRFAVSHHSYDAFGHRSAWFKTTTLPQVGHIPHVKQYSSTIQVNDPDGDYRKMWLVQHAVQVFLLVLVPVGFAFPSLVLNDIMAVVFVAHHHWGFEHILSDYASPRNIGALLSRVWHYLNYVLSLVVLVGLLMFNHNDVGIAEAVSMAWEFGYKFGRDFFTGESLETDESQESEESALEGETKEGECVCPPTPETAETSGTPPETADTPPETPPTTPGRPGCDKK